jgi:FtsZ-binding cell division protein ZapB
LISHTAYLYCLVWQLDFTVLKYKNQKLSEQLEAHKFEYRALENKFAGLKEKQRTHNETLSLVNSSWEQVSYYFVHVLPKKTDFIMFLPESLYLISLWQT